MKVWDVLEGGGQEEMTGIFSSRQRAGRQGYAAWRPFSEGGAASALDYEQEGEKEG